MPDPDQIPPASAVADAMTDTQDVYTLRQVATLMRVSVRTAQRWKEQGLLQTHQIGGKGHTNYVHREELLRFISQLRVAGVDRAIDSTDDASVDDLLARWYRHASANGDDPKAVLRWLAARTLDFRQREPGIAARERRLAFGPQQQGEEP